MSFSQEVEYVFFVIILGGKTLKGAHVPLQILWINCSALIAFQLVRVFEYNNEISFVANNIINNYS